MADLLCGGGCRPLDGAAFCQRLAVGQRLRWPPAKPLALPRRRARLGQRAEEEDSGLSPFQPLRRSRRPAAGGRGGSQRPVPWGLCTQPPMNAVAASAVTLVRRGDVAASGEQAGIAGHRGEGHNSPHTEGMVGTQTTRGQRDHSRRGRGTGKPDVLCSGEDNHRMAVSDPRDGWMDDWMDGKGVPDRWPRCLFSSPSIHPFIHSSNPPRQRRGRTLAAFEARPTSQMAHEEWPCEPPGA